MEKKEQKQKGKKKAALSLRHPIIREIKDSTVFLRDNTMLAVAEIAPISFDSMSDKRKDEVLAKYKAWVESLHYPVQIVARTENSDFAEQAKILKNQVEHMIKQKIEFRELLNLFKEYELWFDSYIPKNSRNETIYYLVIPFMNAEKPRFLEKMSKSKLKAKYDSTISALNKRFEECISMLEKTGVKASRLDTEQLKNLYWSYYSIHNYSAEPVGSQKKGYIGPEDWFGMWKDAMEDKN